MPKVNWLPLINVLFSMYYAKYYSAHLQAAEIERNHLCQEVLFISIT